jgi:hypothetical protein
VVARTCQEYALIMVFECYDNSEVLGNVGTSAGNIPQLLLKAHHGTTVVIIRTTNVKIDCA